MGDVMAECEKCGKEFLATDTEIRVDDGHGVDVVCEDGDCPNTPEESGGD